MVNDGSNPVGFVGVSTVTYRVLSEQEQLGAKQFESPILKGIQKAGKVFV